MTEVGEVVPLTLVLDLPNQLVNRNIKRGVLDVVHEFVTFACLQIPGALLCHAIEYSEKIKAAL